MDGNKKNCQKHCFSRFNGFLVCCCFFVTHSPTFLTYPLTYIADIPIWPSYLTKKAFYLIQTQTRAVSQCLWCFSSSDFHIFHLYKSCWSADSADYATRLIMKCDLNFYIFLLQKIPEKCQEMFGKQLQIIKKKGKTESQFNHSYESGVGAKVKVFKWYWKKWNGPILMHIYDKQCEIIQKIWWKRSNGQNHCFCNGKSAPRC